MEAVRRVDGRVQEAVLTPTRVVTGAVHSVVVVPSTRAVKVTVPVGVPAAAGKTWADSWTVPVDP